MSKNKTAKYKPTAKVIGLETGFVQAAMMLDVAAQSAINTGNVDAMVAIAEQWMGMSLTMKAVLEAEEMAEDDEDEDGHSRHDKGSPVGFGVKVEDIRRHHDRNK